MPPRGRPREYLPGSISICFSWPNLRERVSVKFCHWRETTRIPEREKRGIWGVMGTCVLQRSLIMTENFVKELQEGQEERAEDEMWGGLAWVWKIPDSRKAHKILQVSRGNSNSERERDYRVTSTWPSHIGVMKCQPNMVITMLTPYLTKVFFFRSLPWLYSRNQREYGIYLTQVLFISFFPLGQNNSITILSPPSAILVYSSDKKLKLFALTSMAHQVIIIIILNFYITAKGCKEFINSANSGL